jgi:hypothetical protein
MWADGAKGNVTGEQTKRAVRHLQGGTTARMERREVR